MYAENIKKKGGWKGWRNFVIYKIVLESDEINSFYLKPQDNGAIANFKPGQYISVKTFVPTLGHDQPRQYSLSGSFSPKYYRISVKKETGNNGLHNGLVSNVMHNKNVGDVIEVSSPSGLFFADTQGDNPMVLISGGVGITPMMSILESNKNLEISNRTVWLHSCRNQNVHAFKDELEHLSRNENWLKSFVFYENMPDNPCSAREGRIDLVEIKDEILIDNAKYYLCGPEVFIKTQFESLLKLGINKADILYEEFGPQLLSLN